MYGGDVGLQVIDLSPLSENDPIQLNTYNYIGQSHNLWIDSTGYAFIEHQTGDNIHIVNLEDPSSPVYESTFGNQGQNCHDIYTYNNLAYISEGWSNQFGIYNINNLNNIELLATIPCEGYAHNAWLTEDEQYLITTEETQGKTVKIWDITDFNDISLIGEYLGENGLAHNVHIKGNHAFISHYTTGIKILDIFNPSDPIEVAAYDTYPLNDDDGFFGCWGAYPFTQNNYIYASDMQNGLFILNFDNINAGWRQGFLYINNTIAPNVSIKSILNNKIFSTDNNGFFHFGFPEGEHAFLINSQDTVYLNFLGHVDIIDNITINNNALIGDVNGDQEIDVLDIIFTINIILNNYTPNENEIWAADINHDNFINIQDIILIIQIILQSA